MKRRGQKVERRTDEPPSFPRHKRETKMAENKIHETDPICNCSPQKKEYVSISLSEPLREIFLHHSDEIVNRKIFTFHFNGCIQTIIYFK